MHFNINEYALISEMHLIMRKYGIGIIHIMLYRVHAQYTRHIACDMHCTRHVTCMETKGSYQLTMYIYCTIHMRGTQLNTRYAALFNAWGQNLTLWMMQLYDIPPRRLVPPFLSSSILSPLLSSLHPTSPPTLITSRLWHFVKRSRRQLSRS